MNDLYLRPPLEQEKKHNNASQSYFYKSSIESVNNNNSYISTTSLSYNEYMYNKENLPNENFEFYPRILHIPNSITCQNDFSWGFWNWIHSKDDLQQDNTRIDRYPNEDETISFTKIFNQDGNQFILKPSFDHHPKHFHIERNNIPTPKSEAIANVNKNPSSLNCYVNAMGASTNHSNLKGVSPNIIPRFYLQVLNFKGDHVNNVSSICCSLDINGKKIFTGISPCIKNSDGTVSAHFNEAYVFDASSMDFKVTVSVYGLYHKTLNKSFIHNIKETLNIKNESKKAVKPSYTGVFRNHHLNSNDLNLLASNAVNGPKNSTLNKSISIISNTFSLKKGHCRKDSTKNPMDNIDVAGKEIFLGDYEMSFNVQKMDKTTTSYKLKPVIIPSKNNGPPIVSKYQQNIVIQTGIYMDEKVKETIAYINENIYCDYLSVQLSTTTVPVWKRYWVIFKENFLTFYDFEYKEKKEPIGKIDIHTLKSVGLPNPEYNSMPNCFCIEFQDGKDLADIVGVYQKEGDYNEKNVEAEANNTKKYARIKPKEELLLKKEIVPSQEISNSESNINSNNTLYSSKREGLDDEKKEEEGKENAIPSIEVQDGDAEEANDSSNLAEEKKDETLNSLDNVALNMDTIENMIKNISVDVNTSNNTLHQQEKIPHYEWINRVVTKSYAYFYTDSPSKLNQWMKMIEDSPCFQIEK
eukprot:jgi/Orpsp1_1/1189300/evm.model.d7180000070960.1